MFSPDPEGLVTVKGKLRIAMRRRLNEQDAQDVERDTMTCCGSRPLQCGHRKACKARYDRLAGMLPLPELPKSNSIYGRKASRGSWLRATLHLPRTERERIY
jgi:hypothetical protein